MAKSAKVVSGSADALETETKALKLFLTQNKWSSLSALESKEHGLHFVYVDKPWGDDSLGLYVGTDGKDAPERNALIEALNNVILPQRLSAIYHRDRSSLEIIWTAYQLDSDVADIGDRKFEFAYDGKNFACEFSRTSDRLLAIAQRAIFLKISDSQFRNLNSFQAFMEDQNEATEVNEAEERIKFGTPLSLYIHGIKWNEEKVLEIIRHLNFYLKFYDGNCPYIVIHPSQDTDKFKERNRYINGAFPNIIVSRKLNPTWLAFWNAAYDQDDQTRFLLHYRILEYSASYHLQSTQRAEARRILSTPHLLHDIENTIDRFAGLVREDRNNDHSRFTKTFEEIVKPETIWSEILRNPDAFTKPVDLEGGFRIEAIVSKVEDISYFIPKGMESVARTLRAIRNGLAHGGEAQSGRLILPTNRNYKKLVPWGQVIAAAAGEVVLYDHLT